MSFDWLHQGGQLGGVAEDVSRNCSVREGDLLQAIARGAGSLFEQQARTVSLQFWMCISADASEC